MHVCAYIDFVFLKDKMRLRFSKSDDRFSYTK